MRKCKWILTIVLCFTLCGCASWFNKIPTVPTQESDKIYGVAIGTKIPVYYDGKSLTLTVNTDMFLVTSEFLLKVDSEYLQKKLKQVKAEADAKKKLILWGSIATIVVTVIATGLGVFLRAKNKGGAISVKAETQG